MDPNATLAEIRRLASAIRSDADAGIGASRLPLRSARLAELCEALDGWISRGGFLPDAWDPEIRGALRKLRR